MTMKKILASGLGGGLDIVNASLIYFAAKNEGISASLGSSRPAPLNRIENHFPFSDNGTWLNRDSIIHYGGLNGPPRYPEPRIASLLEEDVLFLSRKYNDKNNVPRLRQAILKAQKDFSHMFFVDGGGDSLTFIVDDADGTTENATDPFTGGDSIVLEALAKVPNTYLAVVAVGLDVSESGFERNIELLKEAYFGRINLATGEKEDYKLDHVIKFEDGFLTPYFHLCENVLAFNRRDLQDPTKTMSHTAVVTYHAMKGSYEVHRTFVRWEPEVEGRKGVLVKPEHCWMYFFDASVIHPLKVELNK